MSNRREHRNVRAICKKELPKLQTSTFDEHDPEIIDELIDGALQRAARAGLIVDTGEKVWSARRGRFVTLWSSLIYKDPDTH
jgi:hypothetical protein